MSNYKDIDPARAKSKKDVEKIYGDPMWIAEEKLDGWRFLMHFGGSLERPFLTGRRISATTGRHSEKGGLVPHLWPTIDQGYTVLDGEIMPPQGADFRDLASMMNASPEESERAMQRLGRPTYHVFDVLYHDNIDVREHCLAERRKLVADVVSRLMNPHVRRVQSMTCDRASFDSIVAMGGEGLILKNLAGAYGEDWVKVKKASTLEVIISGYTEARMGVTGKYLGQIGAVVVSVYGSSGQLLEVGQVSGMTDEERRLISDSRGEWLGQVIEIEAQEWAKDRLRHPRWRGRARQDVDARTCTLTKLMRDLGESDDEEAREPQESQSPKQRSLF